MVPNGILGLSNDKSVDNFVDLFHNLGQIEQNVFGFELQLSSSNSTFYFGGIPDKYKDKLVRVDAADDNEWSIEIIGAKFDEISFTPDTNKAIVDSGTSLLALDYITYGKISFYFDFANCVNSYFYGIYCDCNKIDIMPTITLYAVGAEFVLEPKDYFITMNDRCILGAQLIFGLPFILLGDVFIRKYPTFYHKKEDYMEFVNAQTFPLVDDTELMVLSILYIAQFGIIVILGIYFLIKPVKRTYIYPQNRAPLLNA